MSVTKFTKGPWVFGVPTDHAPHCIGARCNVDNLLFQVCSVWGVDKDSESCEQTEANANLITSAPELYSQLEESNDCMRALADALKESGRTTTDLLKQIDFNEQILAKARGEL